MRIVRRRPPGSIQYPRSVRRSGAESLEDSLRRILRGRAGNLTIAAGPSPRRREIVRRYRFHRWQRLRRWRSEEIGTSLLVDTSRRLRTVTESFSFGRGQNEGALLTDERSRTRATLSSGHNLRTGDLAAAAQIGNQRRDRTSQFGTGRAMSSQNDSIIWNNRSSDQVGTEVESNLSLVVNPPSSISQQEDSALSEDSQYTRSSQLDLALEDERRWMKYRIENLTRDECIITCVLAQVCADIMMLSSDELPGSRELIPSDEEAKQSLLYLSYGGCWELNSLRTVLDLAEFLPVGLRRLCGLGVRDRGSSSRKILEGRLEQCLDLTRRLNLQQAG